MKVQQEASNKSKVRYLIDNKEENIYHRPNYMKTLNKKQAKNILIVRTRMMKVKCNFKTMYTNLECRWCGIEEETQDHIIERCKDFPAENKLFKIEELFQQNIKNIYEICNNLKDINDILDK